jgi:site-specific recombinase XerC
VQVGEYVEPAKKTLKKYLEYWLENSARPRVAPRTLQRYSEIVRLHIVARLGEMPINKIRPVHIQELYSEAVKSGLSPVSVLYIHQVMHNALKQAVKWHVLPRNTAKAMESPKDGKQRPAVLTVEEMRILLQELEGSVM